MGWKNVLDGEIYFRKHIFSDWRRHDAIPAVHISGENFQNYFFCLAHFSATIRHYLRTDTLTSTLSTPTPPSHPHPPSQHPPRPHPQPKLHPLNTHLAHNPNPHPLNTHPPHPHPHPHHHHSSKKKGSSS